MVLKTSIIVNDFTCYISFGYKPAEFFVEDSAKSSMKLERRELKGELKKERGRPKAESRRPNEEI